MLDDTTLDAWAASDDPVRRAHAANLRALRDGTMPPLRTQAANLAGAVVRFVASGGKRTTPEQQAGRLAICRGCDRFADGRCRECACYLMAKVKAASEHCPLGRW